MANGDDRFDQQIRDAYDQVRLDDAAQDRILANLLAAQKEQVAQEEAAPASNTAPMDVTVPMEDVASETNAGAGRTAEQTTASDVRGQAPVIPFQPRRSRWRVVLPVAAAIVATALVVSIPLRAQKASDASAPMETSNATAYDSDDVIASKEGDGVTFAESSAAPEASIEPLDEEAATGEGAAEATLRPVDYYPIVVLSDGTNLTALIDGLTVKEVKAQQVGELLGVAEAHPTDTTSVTYACEVYRLKNDEAAYAVRYEGEDTYWYCTEVKR